MNVTADRILTFGEFEVDSARRLLLREGNVVHLKSKTFDLLITLIDHRERVLSKNDLLDLVWAGQIVEENNLTVHVAALRKALGETKNYRRYIVTVPGSGYRFVGKLNGHAENGTIINGKQPFTLPLPEQARADTGISSRLRLVGVVVTVLAFLFLLVAGTGVYLWVRPRSPATFSQASRNLTIRRLTTDGKTTGGALSGDGKLYVYSRIEGEEQSIWLGNVEGGEPILIRPAASESYYSFRFSPGGESIYFAARTFDGKRATYRMPVFGGTAEKIKNDAYTITFDPPGKRFAFVRHDLKTGEDDLTGCDALGENETKLGIAPDGLSFVPESIAWSPDGSRIAVAASRNDTDQTFDVFTVTIADGSVSKLTDHAWTGFGAIAWSADGTGLVVNARDEESLRRQLWAVSYPEGNVRHWIIDLNRYDGAITLSASGNILLTVQEQTQSNIWVSPSADLNLAKQITDGAIGRMDGWYGVKWTPDDAIVYTNEVDGNNSIWIMNADGSGKRQLVSSDANNVYPSLSSDGRFLVFQSNRSRKNAIWMAAIDGSELKQVTNDGIAAQPHLSPDGRWIVYVSNTETAGEMWRIPTNGGEPLKLAEKASWPRISPDSRFIACGYDAGGIKLAILSIDGGEPIKLFDLPRLANLRLGANWTPDGKAITYRDWTNGIWRQDLSGGEPQRLKGLPSEKLYAFDWSRDGKRFAYTRGMEIRDIVLINSSN
ncbi:MAG: winged helix-turn-helix domain-containing protein [Acidobacteriota bacterium]